MAGRPETAPSAPRQRRTLVGDTVDTPGGPMAVLADSAGAVWWAALRSLQDVAADVPSHLAWTPGALPRRVVTATRAYAGGELDALSHVPVVIQAAQPLTREVLHAVRQVPPGFTMTYGELALEVGRPGAARAVGSACGRSTLGLFVPCHRVVSARGIAAGGFAPGVQARLLAHEGARAST